MSVQMGKISIISYNVWGIGNEKKRRKTFNYLHEHKYSIILMQETHSTQAIERLWTAEWGGKIFFANGTNTSKGVAILVSKGLNFEVKEIVRDIQGRYIILSIKKDSVDLVLTSVYAPNTDSPEFFVDMFSKIETCDGRKLIAGDFNTVLDSKKDIKGGKGYSHVNSTKFLNGYINDNDLIDIWRMSHLNQFTSTFIQKESTIASA